MGMILELRRFPAAPPPIMEIQASLTKTAKRKDKERLERKEEERDVFREIPLRYLGKPMKDEQVIIYDGSKHLFPP